MSWFRIVKGELVMPVGCKDWDEAWDSWGKTKANDDYRNTKPGEPIVAFGGAEERFLSVPKRDMIIYVGSWSCLSLFCAIDEDNGGREVIVAWDDRDSSEQPEKRWRIVTSDHWVQMPCNKCIVRYFRSKEEANSSFGETITALQRVDDLSGWQCTLAFQGRWIWSEVERLLKTSQFIEALQIPDGMPALVNASAFQSTLYPGLVKGLPPLEFIHSSTVITPRAEFFVIFVAKEGDEEGHGLKFFTRLFTYNEARAAVERSDSE